MSEKKITYNEAVNEIEEILHQIENEELDVDYLSEKVKRAYYLLRLCKDKLYSTEQEIEKIMKDFADESQWTTPGQSPEVSNGIYCFQPRGSGY